MDRPHDARPVQLHPGRRVNWYVVGVLLGLLLAWFLLVIAVLREFS